MAMSMCPLSAGCGTSPVTHSPADSPGPTTTTQDKATPEAPAEKPTEAPAEKPTEAPAEKPTEGKTFTEEDIEQFGKAFVAALMEGRSPDYALTTQELKQVFSP